MPSLARPIDDLLAFTNSTETSSWKAGSVPANVTQRDTCQRNMLMYYTEIEADRYNFPVSV